MVWSKMARMDLAMVKDSGNTDHDKWGNPLSPLLFTLDADGLHSIINKAKGKKKKSD